MQVPGDALDALRALPPLHLRFCNVASIELLPQSFPEPNWLPNNNRSQTVLVIDGGLFESFVRNDACHLAQLRRLDLSQTNLGAAAVAALAGCFGLSTVLLPAFAGPLPGAALAPLAALPRLRCLAISNVPCDAAALGSLGQLAQLTELRWRVPQSALQVAGTCLITFGGCVT